MAAYNQSINGQSVRIGNWYEELKLKEETGIRYYPAPTAKDSSLLTKSRCIVHTERVEPKEYTTVMRSTIKDPRTYPDFSHLTSAGPKRRLLESAMRAEVEQEMKQKADAAYRESRVVDYTTSGSQWFKKDGFQSSLRENDPNVRVNTHTSSYSTDNAITYYSHALTLRSERVNFPASFVGSTNPFTKHNAFSADIAHNVLARRTETYERPRCVPTLHEFKILRGFREKLLAQARQAVGAGKGAAARYVADQLMALERDLISFADLQEYISSHFSGLAITRDEEKAMHSAYDYKSNGILFLPELIWLVRPSPAARREELIQHFFSLMPSPQNLDQADGKSMVVISGAAVRDRLKFSGLPPSSLAVREVGAFLDFFGETFTFLDFHMYHADLSAEIEDDYAFEELLRNMWEDILG